MQLQSSFFLDELIWVYWGLQVNIYDPLKYVLLPDLFYFLGKILFFFFPVTDLLRLNQSLYPEMYYRYFAKYKLWTLPNPVFSDLFYDDPFRIIKLSKEQM